MDFTKVLMATGAGVASTLILDMLDDNVEAIQNNPVVGPAIIEGVGLGMLVMGGTKMEPAAYGLLGAAGADFGALIPKKGGEMNGLSRLGDDHELDGWLKNKISNIKRQIKQKKLAPKQVASELVKIHKKAPRSILKGHEKAFRDVVDMSERHHKQAFRGGRKMFGKVDKFNKRMLKRGTPRIAKRNAQRALEMLGMDCQCR